MRTAVDKESWAEVSIGASNTDFMRGANSLQSPDEESLLSFGSQDGSPIASSSRESGSWVEVTVTDCDFEDVQSQRDHLIGNTEAMELSRRLPSPSECDFGRKPVKDLESDEASVEVQAAERKALPRNLPGEQRVEDSLHFCSWQGPAFPAHRLDFRASQGLPILDMEATRVFDVLTQDFVRDGMVEHSLRVEMLDLALDCWKREGRPGWCLNPKSANLKFTHPPQASDDYKLRPPIIEEQQSCFWQTYFRPYYRLYFPVSHGNFDLDVEKARVFDVEAGQFLLGEQCSKVLEDNFFNALEDLEKEGHPGWQTDPGWCCTPDARSQLQYNERAECQPDTMSSDTLEPAASHQEQTCSWTGLKFPGYRLDFPFANGSYVLDLTKIHVYNQETRAYLTAEEGKAEIQEYMLSAAMEAWESSTRKGWRLPVQRRQRPQSLGCQTLQTLADNDYFALRTGQRSSPNTFYYHWESPVYPGRRIYFPASQGVPRLESSEFRVYDVQSRSFATDEAFGNEKEMIAMALQDWNKLPHPNWSFGGEPSLSNRPADIPPKHMTTAAEAGHSSPTKLSQPSESKRHRPAETL